jgi:hypothetical protein
MKTNPFAIITAAHLKIKATKDNPQERYTWKWTITRALYEKGFSTKDILSLYRLVDWLMMLPDELTKKFTQDLIAYEEEKKMPYITSAERMCPFGKVLSVALKSTESTLPFAVTKGCRLARIRPQVACPVTVYAVPPYLPRSSPRAGSSGLQSGFRC